MTNQLSTLNSTLSSTLVDISRREIESNEPTKYEVPIEIQKLVDEINTPSDVYEEVKSKLSNQENIQSQLRKKSVEPKSERLKSTTQINPDKLKTKIKKSNHDSTQDSIESNVDCQLDQSQIQSKVDEIVKTLEHNAELIEESNSYLEIPDDIKSNRQKYIQFILSTDLDSDNHRLDSFKSIDENVYLNSYNIVKYDNRNKPNESIIIKPDEQLVLMNRLSKLFDHKFLTKSDNSYKFSSIDLSICNYLKSHRNESSFKISYDIVNNMLKKLLIVSFGHVESAFRSNYIWTTVQFKNAIVNEILMLQSLPLQLRESFNIFVNELLNTNDKKIFKDGTKLDFIIHDSTKGVIETTLARTLKTMTPMFVYDYFEVVKSIYIFAGLFNKFIDIVRDEQSCETKSNESTQSQSPKHSTHHSMEDVNVISRVVLFMYQNTRYLQNSIPRSLPVLNDKNNESMSSELQMYYLNHTILGPQHCLLTMFERSSSSLY